MIEDLKQELLKLKKVAVAYSGGIDSSFLLYISNMVLGKENVIAVIGNGVMIPRKDYNQAIEFVKVNNFQYHELPIDCLEVLEFKENHKDRCYHCKKAIMSKIIDYAYSHGYNYVVDGKNTDDTKVYRPGNQATSELGVVSPLANANFDKQTIRHYSKEYGLSFWNKPSNSCLATRFPYNTILSNDSLKQVELVEEMIKNIGIPNCRARVHGDILRIEVDPSYFHMILDHRDMIDKLKALGFKFITLDLSGIKSGVFD